MFGQRASHLVLDALYGADVQARVRATSFWRHVRIHVCMSWSDEWCIVEMLDLLCDVLVTAWAPSLCREPKQANGGQVKGTTAQGCRCTASGGITRRRRGARAALLA